MDAASLERLKKMRQKLLIITSKRQVASARCFSFSRIYHYPLPLDNVSACAESICQRITYDFMKPEEDALEDDKESTKLVLFFEESLRHHVQGGCVDVLEILYVKRNTWRCWGVLTQSTGKQQVFVYEIKAIDFTEALPGAPVTDHFFYLYLNWSVV